ncbi:hypothetical protein EAH87_03310 [Sphingomonas koreensis]|nr:hypothetical protein EAH87_03310 [Sphingomonas koreensis]
MIEASSVKSTWAYIIFFMVVWPIMFVSSGIRYSDEHRPLSLIVALGAFVMTLYTLCLLVRKVRGDSPVESSGFD